MKYLNEKDILNLGISWEQTIGVIGEAIEIIKNEDYCQPIKPYVKYKNPRNRIIAMPAHVGGSLNVSGIKWIASFPDNLAAGLSRANSVTILNSSETGLPLAVINTGYISAIRTASVTGYIMRKLLSASGNYRNNLSFGVIGLGPIGRLHMRMVREFFSEYIRRIIIYDKNPARISSVLQEETGFETCSANNLADFVELSDILCTCTTSSAGYISTPPRKGRLYLNVSLRDFEPSFLKKTDVVIVDKWDEVCRENTDVEQAGKHFNVKKEDTIEIHQLDQSQVIKNTVNKSVIFNPMGMAVFDIAIAEYYYQLSIQHDIGITL